MNEKIIRLLNELPKVNAPINFESKLIENINLPKKSDETWIDKIFLPKLIPAAALTVTAIIIIFILAGTSNDYEDPFQLKPKLRAERIESAIDQNSFSKTDLTGSANLDDREQKILSDNNANALIISDEYRGDSDNISSVLTQVSTIQRISVRTINYTPDQKIVSAGGLNYKIVKLGKDELKRLQMLRGKLSGSVENPQKN